MVYLLFALHVGVQNSFAGALLSWSKVTDMRIGVGQIHTHLKVKKRIRSYDHIEGIQGLSHGDILKVISRYSYNSKPDSQTMLSGYYCSLVSLLVFHLPVHVLKFHV